MMATAAESGRAGETPQRPEGSLAFDWGMIGVCTLLVAGTNLDGWAHNHLGTTVETFFTLWHAVLYGGLFAVACYLAIAASKNRLRGYPWRRSLPAGYGLAAVGLVIFGIGGVADLVWHTAFGFETDVEALLAPAHLVLGFAGALIVMAPLRAAWARDSAAPASLARSLPVLLSLTYLLSAITFFSQFAHPFVDPWAAGSHFLPPLPVAESHRLVAPMLGVAGIALQSSILIAVILLAMSRWTLPFGSLTLIITLNAALLTFMKDQFFLIPAALVGGIAADLLAVALKPSATRPVALQVFAFMVPFLLYAAYFVNLLLTSGLWWSVHVWTGAVVIAGIAGWFTGLVFLMGTLTRFNSAGIPLAREASPEAPHSSTASSEAPLFR